jgi:hypothetical protein
MSVVGREGKFLGAVIRLPLNAPPITRTALD